jgi:hypothetical protein
MANTTNFNWETPDDTDLVKDGALAIRTLGNSIDTSFVDLKGGTTGQVLSKASNTDLDYTWVTTDDANAIQNAIVDAKGDLIAASAADTPARLAVGTNGQLLSADSTAATGLKWIAAPDGAGSWTNYTPTITAEVGTFTSVTSQAGRYQMLNSKTCLVQAVWRVVTVGTAVGKTKFTLPFTANSSAQTAVGSARETESTGYQGWVTINASATVAETAKYDNTTFAVNSYTVRTSIIYEVA